MGSPLITPVELAQQFRHVTVLDIRYRTGGDAGPSVYAASHVPGAAYVDLNSELSGPPGGGGRHPLPDPRAFQVAMRRAGVRQHRPVVVYDDWNGRAAGRCWWLLRHHGHRDVRVLDGGWKAWLDLGGPIEQGESGPEPGDFESSPGGMPVIEAEGVTSVDVLIDARAPERYRGEFEPIDRVAGHIPGAVNVPTERNLRPDGRFHSPDVLRKLYEEHGALPGRQVAVYCGSGVTATHDILALEAAGITAALYPGSWSDWTAAGRRPVES